MINLDLRDNINLDNNFKIFVTKKIFKNIKKIKTPKLAKDNNEFQEMKE